MKDSTSLVAEKVSEDEAFKSIAYGALKARANKMVSGDAIKIGGFEMMVVADETGDGVAVQFIMDKVKLETLARTQAQEIGVNIDTLSSREKRDWMAGFYNALAKVLKKWQDIVIYSGPGDSMTFEKAVK